MYSINEYEVAHQRVQTRLKQRYYFFIWSAGTVLLLCFMLLLVITGDYIGPLGLLPIAMFIGHHAITSTLNYFRSRKVLERTELIEQEMDWLFEEGWRSWTGTTEYAFASERIVRQQRLRWQVKSLLVVAAIALGFFIFLLRDYTASEQQTLVYIAGWFGLFYFTYFFYLVDKAFPSQARFADRERKVGEKMRRELQQIEMEKAKSSNKVKRQYVIGDDGELVELDSNSTEFEEKPQRLSD